MLESANSFFSIPLSELSLFDVTMVVLFILALVLTIIFSLILISSKLRRIDSDIKDTSNTQISNNRAILNYLDLISEQLSTKPQSNPVNNSDVRNMEQSTSKAKEELFETEEDLESNIVINQEEIPSTNQEKTIAIINNKKDQDPKELLEKELAEHQENTSSISEEVLNNKHVQQKHSLYNQKFDPKDLQQNLEEKQYNYSQNTNNNLGLQNNNIQEVTNQSNAGALASEQLQNINSANSINTNANLQNRNELLQEQQLHNAGTLIGNNLENTNNLVKELEQSNTRFINENLQLPKLSLQVVENSDTAPNEYGNYSVLNNSYKDNPNKFINQNALNEKENFALDKNPLNGMQLNRQISSTQPSEVTQHDKINNSQLFRKYPNLSRQTLGNTQSENDNDLVEESKNNIMLNQNSVKQNSFSSLFQKTQNTSNTSFHTPNMDKSEEFANRIKKSTLPKHLDNNRELELQSPIPKQNFSSVSRLRESATYKLPNNLSNRKEENNFSRFSPQHNVLNRGLRLNPNLSSRDIPAQRTNEFSKKSNHSNHFGTKEGSRTFSKPLLRITHNPNRVTSTQNDMRSTPSRLKTNSRGLYADTTKDKSFVSSFARVKNTETNKHPTLGSRVQSSSRLQKPKITGSGTRTIGVDKNRPIGRIIEASRKKANDSNNRDANRNRDDSRNTSSSRLERPVERTRIVAKDGYRLNRRSDNKDRSLSTSRR